MPASEIDDIFAGKSTSKKVDTTQDISKKKKKKSKKPADPSEPQKTLKSSKEQPTDGNESKTTKEDIKSRKRKRPVPEEILDPSAPVKRQKTDESGAKLPSKKATKGDIQKFKGSRGSSGRQFIPCECFHILIRTFREANRRRLSDIYRRGTRSN